MAARSRRTACCRRRWSGRSDQSAPLVVEHEDNPEPLAAGHRAPSQSRVEKLRVGRGGLSELCHALFLAQAEVALPFLVVLAARVQLQPVLVSSHGHLQTKY